jgi:hypothetical protein
VPLPICIEIPELPDALKKHERFCNPIHSLLILSVSV